jgi:leucyl/phenylalanyl-tRNA--protein transferase
VRAPEPLMPITRFPDPRLATRDGIVAFGDDLHPDSLILAYRSGIFPWPIEGLPLPWFCPPRRAILEFRSIHISRSLRRARRLTKLRLSVDNAFEKVIDACAHTSRLDKRTGEEAGTWITPEMIAAYTRLHQLGYAHSAEAWEGDNLVAGLYGVSVAGTFSAESMFHIAPDASKLALLHLTDHLASHGLEWMDVQVMSPHLKALGARAISRDEFLALLKATQAKGLALF